MSVNLRSSKMKKALLGFALFFIVGTANATVTLLTGAVHYINPSANWKAPHTVEYNAIYNNMQQCENAKGLIESTSPKAIPESQTNLFGVFSKVSTLTCTYK